MTEFEAEQRARQFVRDAGISAIPVDLTLYVAKVAGKVSLDVLDPGEAGYTMVTGAGPLITVNESDRATRRRFTVCHEIGHLVLDLPSEHGHGPDWSYAKRSPNEVCCDVFAAELLLPIIHFTPLARGLAPDFDAVDDLRVKFFASREATASRLAATSRLACGYLLSEGGLVRHIVRSPALRDARGWVPSGTRLPARSAAAALRSGSAQIRVGHLQRRCVVRRLAGCGAERIERFHPRVRPDPDLAALHGSGRTGSLAARRPPRAR